MHLRDDDPPPPTKSPVAKTPLTGESADHTGPVDSEADAIAKEKRDLDGLRPAKGRF